MEMSAGLVHSEASLPGSPTAPDRRVLTWRFICGWCLFSQRRSSHLTTSSRPSYLPRTPPPHTITLGSGAPTSELGGTIQSIARMDSWRETASQAGPSSRGSEPCVWGGRGTWGFSRHPLSSASGRPEKPGRVADEVLRCPGSELWDPPTSKSCWSPLRRRGAHLAGSC